MAKVGIFELKEYDYEKALESVEILLSGFSYLQKLPKGKVLVKTNLLKKNKPEDGVTTHPYVVEGVVRFFQRLGHLVIIGDSPGGPFTVSALNAVYKASGIEEVANRTGCELNFNIESITVHPENAKLLHTLKLVKAFTEVDYVVSCAKLKTHTMMTYTGAVKNLFGMIPGVTKADYHLNLNDTVNFANMLIDVCEYVKPTLSVIDGIEAMEGDGPSSGDIRKLGLLFAGENPHELDFIAANIAGLGKAPTIIEAIERGLIEPSEIELFGTDIEGLDVTPFKLPRSTHVNFVEGNIPKFVVDFLLDRVRPYPLILEDKCIGCGVCMRNCPAKVISLENHKAVIDLKHCIRCFCCHELCPEKAVGVKRHPLHKLVFGK